MKAHKKLLFFLLMYSVLLLSSCKNEVVSEAQKSDQYIDNSLQSSIRENTNTIQPVKLNDQLKAALFPQQKLAIDDYISPPRFDLSVKDVEAKKFYLQLFNTTSYGVIVSPHIKGKIDLNLRDVTLSELLKHLQDVYGYHFEQSGSNYIIENRHLQTVMFSINRLNIKRSGQVTTEIGGPTRLSSSDEENGSSAENSSSSVTTNSSSNFWQDLYKTINVIIGNQVSNNTTASTRKNTANITTATRKQVQINPESGIIIVRAYPKELQKVRKFLSQADATMNRQVLIEAKILEVQLKREYRFGIDWKLFGSTSTGITPISNSNFGDVYKLSGHHGNNFSAVLQLLSHQGNVSVISSPRVSALNNEKAVIKVGTDQYFITDVSNNVTPVGQTTQSATDVSFSPFFSGVALDVTPQISKNKYITLHIHPSISRVSKATLQYTVNGQESTLPLAKSEVREADSVVRAKNGQMIVIGGLTERNVNLNRSGLPIDGSKTFNKLNAALSSKDDDSNNVELVILLRPVIASTKSWKATILSSKSQLRELKG